MDDLYGDLENYNEVNTVDELRNENKELKLKLEEYETAMGKLQKDYDNLAMELNNLQANYSSLLKTARSEVERKAKMITQLNLEKDMMVLKALQNGNNRRFNNNRNPQGVQNPKNASKAASKEPVKAKVDKKAKNEGKKNTEKQERSETSNVQPTVVPNSDSTKLINIVDNVVEKVDLFISHSELKENIAQPKPVNNTPKNCASSIKDRRKSMPAIRMPKFSSDEEDEPVKLTEPKKRTELPSVQSPDTRNINTILTKLSDEIRSNKTSETSSIDGRSSNYQESQREGYKGRTSRHFETDRYRDHDKVRDNDGHREGDRFREGDKVRERERYRDSDKYKDDRFRDGDRFRRGSDKFREYDKLREGDKRDSDRFRETEKLRETDRYRDNDKYRDGDKYRGRDKYDPSYRHRKHYSPDRPHKRSYREHQDETHRPDYNRYKVLTSPTPPPILEAHGSYPRTQDLRSHLQERHIHDNEKHQPYHEERHVAKPMPIEHDEPRTKRQKLESDMHVEESRIQHDKAPPQSTAQKLSCSEINEHEMLRATCQSPDAAHAHTDAPPTHTVKEIKTTAVMALEDPRVASKKYVLKAENGKTTLSTTVSNVDIKPVDKSLWTKQQVTIPALLHAPPSQITDESIKEIYGDMDIDNTEPKILEPGEIDSDSEEPLSDIYERKYAEKTASDSSKTKPIVLPAQEHNPEPVRKVSTTYRIPKKTASDLSKNVSKVLPEQERNSEPLPKASTTYKIPKKQNNQNTHSKVSNVVKDLPKLACEDTSLDVKGSKDKNNQFSTKILSKLPQTQKNVDFIPSSNEKHDKIHSINNKTFEKKKEEVVAISLSDMAMVHDDLELSDETSDNIELHKQVVTKKELKHNLQSTVQEKLDDSKNKAPAFKIEPLKPNDTDEIPNTEADDKPKGSDTHKKQKTKRRKTRSKEKELHDCTDVNVPEKKTRAKKDKEHKPKEVKNKFTDLFGDSNSLITPEDLGIPSSCVPLCEDAVDLDIQEIAKAPPSSIMNEKIINDVNTNGFHDETTSNTLLENPNTEDKEIAKRIEEQIASPEVNPNIVYQNLNTEVEADKPDIVKTVIISSGVQPQFEIAKTQESTEKRIMDVEVDIQNIMDHQRPVFVELKKQNSLQALATSTPHKDYAILNTVEPYCKVVESASNGNDSKNESSNTTGPGADQSYNNAQNSNDAPDVRIFVKRRRKGAKKT